MWFIIRMCFEMRGQHCGMCKILIAYVTDKRSLTSMNSYMRTQSSTWYKPKIIIEIIVIGRSFKTYLSLQISHSYGFSPKCRLKCTVNVELCWKDLPQVEHRYGLCWSALGGLVSWLLQSLWCFCRICTDRLPDWVKQLLHTWQV